MPAPKVAVCPSRPRYAQQAEMTANTSRMSRGNRPSRRVPMTSDATNSHKTSQKKTNKAQRCRRHALAGAGDEQLQDGGNNDDDGNCQDIASENANNASDKHSDDEAAKEKQEEKRDDRFYAIFDRFQGKRTPGKKTRPFPARVDSVTPIAPELRKTTAEPVYAARSFEEAAEQCSRKVAALVKECKRLNVKYTDQLFYLPEKNTLASLKGMVQGDEPESLCPVAGVPAARRINQIFDDPQFYVDGTDANDICQGRIGDCWFLAGIAALSGMSGLLERVCVARDEKCGVYGFVFFRDGDWISTVVDDKLCIRHDEARVRWILNVTNGSDNPRNDNLRQMTFDPIPKKEAEAKLRSSENLYFSKCRDPKETWLPLLEKAYAKVHGSYQAIEGGFSGEAVEDLTGGVTTMYNSADVLDVDALWAELEQVNKKFLFSSGTRFGGNDEDYEGLVKGHAYTVLKAQRYEDARLLKIRNPWGKKEWDGAWSDGSKEWTAEALRVLGHTFGDDGEFYMTLEDFLKYFTEFDRTRLFLDPEWVMTQRWFSSQIPRSTPYYDTAYLSHKVTLTITKAGPVVIVLSVPDERYFAGLEGRYSFELHFRVCKAGDDESECLIRSMSSTGSNRSCNAEIHLEPGSYSIFVKLLPYRWDFKATAAEVMKRFAKSNREKVMEAGRQFDVAFARGNLRKLEADLAAKAKQDKKDEEVDRRKAMKNYSVQCRKRDKMLEHRNRVETERKREARRMELQGRQRRRTANPATEEDAEDGDRNNKSSSGRGSDEGWVNEDGDEGGDEGDEGGEQSDDKQEPTPPYTHGEGGADDAKEEEEEDEEEEQDEQDDDVTVSSVGEHDFDWDDEYDGRLACEDDSDEPEDKYVAGMPDCEFWDAIAVVGLRVYSTDAATSVSVQEV